MDEAIAKSAADYPDTSRNRHLFGAGPKRILAIDGGGVRGVISLTFLAQIETTLRVRTNNPKLRLCDYFDLVGGTSTGAIIAAGIALGYSVERLIDIYSSLSVDGFKKSGKLVLGGFLAPKFKEAPLTKAIHDRVQDETLGSDKLLTGLAIVAKRLDSESVWVMHNNPRGKYYGDDDPAKKSKGIPNKDYPLRNLLRASTAAPSYFTPQSIEVAHDDKGNVVKGVFVDGGVSPHNNPGLLMFMLATLKGYGFRWPTGAEKLMLVSVGNGNAGDAPTHDRATSIPSALLGVKSLSSMMRDCSELNQALLQWMSRCPTPWQIDSEIGNLADDQLGAQALLHYIRYDVVLEADWLLEHPKLSYNPAELAKIRMFDRPELLTEWLKIGRRSAELQVKPDHFPAAFDAIPQPVGSQATAGAQ
jgi:patatin-like phospholipase